MESNFLTATCSQIIVKVLLVAKTMRLPWTTTRREFPSWQVLTCLLLVALFFYNPFLAIARPSDGLAVCHPGSHRATVGSSELEQFAQPSGSPIALLPKVADAQELLPQVIPNDFAWRHFVEEQFVVTPQTGFSSSLWFRPPPVV